MSTFKKGDRVGHMDDPIPEGTVIGASVAKPLILVAWTSGCELIPKLLTERGEVVISGRSKRIATRSHPDSLLPLP